MSLLEAGNDATITSNGTLALQAGETLYAGNNHAITAQCALIYAEGRAQMPGDFFYALAKNIGHVSRDFDWPQIPENYKIPDHYDYKGPE